MVHDPGLRLLVEPHALAAMIVEIHSLAASAYGSN